MPPGDFAGWAAARERALEAAAEAAAAADVRDAGVAALDKARSGILQALAATGAEPLADDADVIAAARVRALQLQAEAARRERLASDLKTFERRAAELAREAADLTARGTALDTELVELVGQGGMQPGATAIALFDALEALSAIVEDIGARDGLERQVSGMRRDADEFDRATTELLADLGRAATRQATEVVRSLAAELARAIADNTTYLRLTGERQRLMSELDGYERRGTVAQQVVDRLLAQAGLESESELDAVVADCARATTLNNAERDALGELAAIASGADLASLEAEVAAIPGDAATAELRRISERRAELATEREAVGRELSDAERAAGQAAVETAAADAQQTAAEASAALAAAAEQHVVAAASAAMLRWLIDRHRATSQAPLIARASALFAQVTGGAFAGLAVGYDAADRPMIVARRADGTQVGVEAMSEGTRDQLYLTLRLSSIEGRVGVQPLPLVCDDLLITADDARAGAMLNVLSAASSWTQVLLFSHHEHIIDVARRSIGEEAFRLHRIEPAVATAAA